MLVFFVNHSTAPVNLGGAERSMIALVEDWSAADPDFRPFFLTKAPRGRFIDAIEQRGWPYLALRFRGWALPDAKRSTAESAYFARDDYDATLRMIAVMEERKPDLVVTNTVVAPWGAFAAKALGIPHAWFVREYGDLDHGLVFQLGRERTLEDIGTLSEIVFVNSLALREHVAPFIEAAKLGVVYPRVDREALAALAAQTPATEPFPGEQGSLSVTMVGRLSPSKGQRDAILAIAELRERGVSANLCLVGSSEHPGYEKVLSSEARQLGIGDRVRFVGEQANPFPYVRMSDVCLTASAMEAFGRTTLEYLALGKAVVATSSGGSAELVENGRTGGLYDPGDVRALASALERYARDPRLVTAHGHNAAQRAGEIAGRGFDNASAIARMSSLVGTAAYRLPHASQYWFGLPGLFLSARSSGSGVLIRALAARVARGVRSRLRPARASRTPGAPGKKSGL